MNAWDFFTNKDAWRYGIYPLSQVNFGGSCLKSMRVHLFWPEKTDEISRRHQRTRRELTSEKRVISMKFLLSFLRRQLAGKPLVASRNFVCFLKLHLFKLLHKKVRKVV